MWCAPDNTSGIHMSDSVNCCNHCRMGALRASNVQKPHQCCWPTGHSSPLNIRTVARGPDSITRTTYLPPSGGAVQLPPWRNTSHFTERRDDRSEHCVLTVESPPASYVCCCPRSEWCRHWGRRRPSGSSAATSCLWKHKGKYVDTDGVSSQ